MATRPAAYTQANHYAVKRASGQPRRASPDLEFLVVGARRKFLAESACCFEVFAV
jgi:hypothetical protein